MSEIPESPDEGGSATDETLEVTAAPIVREADTGDVEAAQPKSRWKKRAWVAGGLVLGAGIVAAIAAYLKNTVEQSDEEDSDDLDFDFDHDDDDDDWIVDEDLRDHFDEQEEILMELAVGRETLDEDEWDSLYDQLDDHHQMKASDELAEWADDAVGHPSWRSDA